MINFTSSCSGAAALSVWPGTSDHLDLPMLSSSGQGISSWSFHGCARGSSQGLCTKPSRMISGRGWGGTRAQLSSPQPPPCCLSSQSATAEEGTRRRWPRSRSPCGSVDPPPSGTAPRRPGTGGCFSRADKKTDGIYLLKLLFSIVKLELKVMPKGRGCFFLTDGPFSSLPDTPDPQQQWSTAHPITTSRLGNKGSHVLTGPQLGFCLYHSSLMRYKDDQTHSSALSKQRPPQGCSGHWQVIESWKGLGWEGP